MTDPDDLSPERRAAIGFGRKADWIMAVTIMVIAVVFIWMLQPLPQRATFFPWFITISILIIGTVYGVGKLRNPARWDAEYDPEEEFGDTGPPFLVEFRAGILRALVVFVCLIAGTMAFGPKLAVPVFVTIALWLNKENRIVAVLSGIAFWLAIHFVFGKSMSINLPTGYFTDALGL